MVFEEQVHKMIKGGWDFKKNPFEIVFSTGRGGKWALPFLHEEDDSEENDDKEEDPGDDPGDLHSVVRLLLRLHRVGFVGGCSCENITMSSRRSKREVRPTKMCKRMHPNGTYAGV